MTFPFATISWGEPGEIRSFSQQVDTPTALAEALGELYRATPNDPPILAQITRQNLDILLIGLGRPYLASGAEAATSHRVTEDLTCLVYQTGLGLRDESYSAAGTVTDLTTDLVWFMDGSWTEIPRDRALPLGDAIAVAVEFAMSTTVPGRVVWLRDDLEA